MTCIGSLSCQSFGPQPFQIFAQRDLLLPVFGQRTVRWTEYVVGVILAFDHDVTFRIMRMPTSPIRVRWTHENGLETFVIAVMIGGSVGFIIAPAYSVVSVRYRRAMIVRSNCGGL
jgi:hypothetical protein